jgi:putative addiction module component (TIGR02574 family)
MTQNAGRLLEEAMRLSEEEKAELAARLMDSLDPDADDELQSAWGEEISKRLVEFDTGEARAVPWSRARELILSDVDEPDVPGIPSPGHCGSQDRPPVVRSTKWGSEKTVRD